MKEYVEIDLKNLSKMLSIIGINRLNIFCVDEIEGITKTVIKEHSEILFIELDVKKFIELLNNPEEKFLDYNKNSLYILRNSTYKDAKLIFSKINNQDINLGRGGSQKSHIISPLDFRLSSYIMAMFNFNYNYINNLNNFNCLYKDQYLPFYSYITNKNIKKNEYE